MPLSHSGCTAKPAIRCPASSGFCRFWIHHSVSSCLSSCYLVAVRKANAVSSSPGDGIARQDSTRIPSRSAIRSRTANRPEHHLQGGQRRMLSQQAVQGLGKRFPRGRVRRSGGIRVGWLEPSEPLGQVRNGVRAGGPQRRLGRFPTPETPPESRPCHLAVQASLRFSFIRSAVSHCSAAAMRVSRSASIGRAPRSR